MCELVARLPVGQPAVSQHLRKLRQAGFLTERRHKYWTYYAIRADMTPILKEIVATLPREVDDEGWLMANQVDTTCAVVRAPGTDAPDRTKNLEGGATVNGR